MLQIDDDSNDMLLYTFHGCMQDLIRKYNQYTVEFTRFPDIHYTCVSDDE